MKRTIGWLSAVGIALALAYACGAPGSVDPTTESPQAIPTRAEPSPTPPPTADGHPSSGIPLLPDPPHAPCEPAESEVRSKSLDMALCVPASWRTVEGAPIEAGGTLERNAVILVSEEYFSPEASSTSGHGAIRIRLNYVATTTGFGGCTPSQPFTQRHEFLFCEDTYDIVGGDAIYRTEGVTTAFKLLAPAPYDIIAGESRPGTRLYVKIVFPSADRDAVADEIGRLIASITLPNGDQAP